MYEDVLEFLSRVEDPVQNPYKRRPFTEDALDTLRRRHPGIPEDYLAYLREVGSGTLRERQFSVFSTLIEPSYLLCDDQFRLDGMLVCFGNNLAGNPSGFVFGDWRIVEVDYTNFALTEYQGSFSSYIRKQILMGEGGQDLRAS